MKLEQWLDLLDSERLGHKVVTPTCPVDEDPKVALAAALLELDRLERDLERARFAAKQWEQIARSAEACASSWEWSALRSDPTERLYGRLARMQLVILGGGRSNDPHALAEFGRFASACLDKTLSRRVASVVPLHGAKAGAA